MLAYYRNYALYRRSLNTICVGMLLAILLLSAALSQVFTNVLVNEAGRQSERTAAIVSANIDQLRAEILTMGAYLGNDNANINTMMFESKHDRMREYAGYLAMRQLQSTYSRVSFIAVYNQGMDELFATVALTEDSRAALKTLALQKYYEGERDGFALLDLRLRVYEEHKSTLPSMALLFYSPLSTRASIGAIAIGLDCAYMQSYIGAMLDADPQTALLISGDGRYISHPDEKKILKSGAEEPYIKEVIADARTSGSLRGSVEGVDMQITFLKSPRGWIYISLLPYETLLRRVVFWRNAVVGVSLAVLALAALYALFGARHTFRPIEELMDSKPSASRGVDMDFLTRQITAYRRDLEHKRLLGEDALRLWLKGEASPERAALAEEEMNAAGPQRVALLRVDHTEAFRALEEQARRGLMEAIAGDCLPALEAVKARLVPLSDNTVCAFWPGPADAPNSEMADRLAAALKTFYARFGQPCCAALPAPAPEPARLPAACASGLQLLQERYYERGESVSVYRRLTPRAPGGNYDFSLELAIWQAIQQGDGAALRERLADFAGAMRQMEIEPARIYTRQLLSNIAANQMARRPEADANECFRAMERIQALETLTQVEAALYALFSSWQEKEEPAASDSGRRIAETAVKLTRERYAEANFAINDVAEALSLSPTYCNRAIKKALGLSFAAYLNGYRLHMVCMLLRTTALPLNQIYARCGIANENYAYTLFKKEYGVTPSQYRERYRLGDEGGDVIT